jgi:hypothetical protein
VKKTKARIPTRRSISVLRQLCNLIPNQLVPKLARATGADKKARTFLPWSHVVSLLYAHLVHALSLNDVCDGLQLHAGPLSAIRAATPPSRNNLSHANKHRDASLAERLFWDVLAHLQSLDRSFARGWRGKGVTRRFQRAIHVVDSTTIQLIASCMDWAKHRRRKAAAKCHLRLDLHSFLPRFAIVDTARHHDNKRAREMCATIRDGEIVLFDKACVEFLHLWELLQRGVFWVTRAKDNLQYRRVKRLRKSKDKRIVSDELIVLTTDATRRQYPGRLRRVVARVEVNGVEQEMVFLTNHLDWAATTVADLYRCRWQIEVFFKQIKQTLQLADFLGTSANAVRWQVWMALLAYVRLRFLAWVHSWGHSFSRLFTVVRAVLWQRRALADLFAFYGTAGARYRMIAMPQQAYLPGFE